MKKLIYLLGVIVLLSSCGGNNKPVEIDDVISVSSSTFSTHLHTLKINDKTDFDGYSPYKLTSKIELKDYLVEKKGKTYRVVIEDLISKRKELDAEKKKIKEQKDKKKKKKNEQALKKLPKMEKKFLKKTDEFNGNTWYTHKTWGKYYPNRKTLVAKVNSNGFIYLKSNYYSSDWLFHTSIKVKIGNKKYKTLDVPRYSENNDTDNSGGDIWESVSYLESDNGIIKAIAENVNSKVLVRFNGSKHYDESTLSTRDKNAIKDCYELSNLLKSVQ